MIIIDWPLLVAAFTKIKSFLELGVYQGSSGDHTFYFNKSVELFVSEFTDGVKYGEFNYFHENFRVDVTIIVKVFTSHGESDIVQVGENNVGLIADPDCNGTGSMHEINIGNLKTLSILITHFNYFIFIGFILVFIPEIEQEFSEYSIYVTSCSWFLDPEMQFSSCLFDIKEAFLFEFFSFLLSSCIDF
jgi:hypothetical protein